MSLTSRLIATLVAGSLSLVPRIAAGPPVTAGTLEWTTNVQKSAPAVTSCVSVTPNASANVNSNWFEVIASTSTAIIVTAVVVDANGGSGGATIELGTGAAAAEVAIGQTHEEIFQAEGAPNVLYFDPPLDNIAASTRVAVRLNKTTTSTATWCVRLNYLEKPIVGYLTTTASAQTSLGGTITSSGSAWANPAWTQLSASTSSDWTITGITYTGASCYAHYVEVDIGVGTAGNEVVVKSVPLYFPDTGGALCLFNNPTGNHNIWPYVTVASGARVTLRVRKSGGGSDNKFISVVYVPTASGMSALTSAVAETMQPAAANNTAVTSGTTWGNGSYVEFISSTGSPIAITGYNIEGGSAECEVDVSTGASSSEVVQRVLRCQLDDNRGGSNYTTPIIPAINVPTSTRVALRTRTRSGVAQSHVVKFSYIANPDFDQRTSNYGGTYPAAANGAAVTPNGSAGVDSAWAVLSSSTAANLLIGGLAIQAGVGGVQVDTDLGVGGAGSEVVVGTISSYHGSGTAGQIAGNRVARFAAPIYIAAGSRLTVRMRQSGTNTTQWGYSVWYTEYSPPAGTLHGVGPIRGCCWPLTKPNARADRRPLRKAA